MLRCISAAIIAALAAAQPASAITYRIDVGGPDIDVFGTITTDGTLDVFGSRASFLGIVTDAPVTLGPQS